MKLNRANLIYKFKVKYLFDNARKREKKIAKYKLKKQKDAR